MSVFVDASALISLIAGEADADLLADRLDGDPDRLCSALSSWETVAGLCRSYGFPVQTARSTVYDFLAAHGFRTVTIGDPEFDIASDAYARFGKGRHPAALNMGDCFAYACTRTNAATLLSKGEDFPLTDIAPTG